VRASFTGLSLDLRAQQSQASRWRAACIPTSSPFRSREQKLQSRARTLGRLHLAVYNPSHAFQRGPRQSVFVPFPFSDAYEIFPLAKKIDQEDHVVACRYERKQVLAMIACPHPRCRRGRVRADAGMALDLTSFFWIELPEERAKHVRIRRRDERLAEGKAREAESYFHDFWVPREGVDLIPHVEAAVERDDAVRQLPLVGRERRGRAQAHGAANQLANRTARLGNYEMIALKLID